MTCRLVAGLWWIRQHTVVHRARCDTCFATWWHVSDCGRSVAGARGDGIAPHACVLLVAQSSHVRGAVYVSAAVHLHERDCVRSFPRLLLYSFSSDHWGCHSPTCRVCAVDWLEASHYECLLQLLEVMALTGGECHVPIRKTVLVLHRLLQLLCTRPRLHHAVPSTSHRAVDNSTPVSASPSRRRAFVCRRVLALPLPLPRPLPCEHASAQ